MVLGGIGNLTSVELYDPASGTWSGGPDMSWTRYRHTATMLEDGRILVVGGNGKDGVLATTELYSP